MKKYVWRILAGLAMLALLTLVAWAYSYSSPMTARASDEWSRGMTIGRTPVNRAIAMQPAPEGGVYMVWPSTEGGMEFAHMGVDGEVLLQLTLPIGEDNGREPQMQVGHDGRLHILWRQRGEPHATIQYALLEADGTLVNQPVTLSDPDHWVVDPPRLVLDEDGSLHAIWADEIGVHWVAMSDEGTLLQDPVLLVPEGYSPAAQMDLGGTVHLAWQQRLGYNVRGMYYAVLDPDSGSISEPEEMAQVFRRIGQAVKGPTIGMDYDTGYLMWEVRDSRAVSRRGQYASFPLDLPRQKRVDSIQLESAWNSSEMYPIDRQHSPLLVALSAEVSDSLWVSEVQIMVVTMEPGETPEYEVWGLASGAPKGRPALFAPGQPGAVAESRMHDERIALRQVAEQVVTASNVPSMKPTLLMDDNSDLHLAWLESAGFRQYRVIYASTTPEVLENYNALTLFDIVDPVLKRIFRLSLVVVAAGPMFVLWALLPLGGLLVYHVITGEETLEVLHARVALAIAVAVEIGLTFVFTPTAISDLPLLRWITPAVTATLAAALTVRILRRREGAENSLLLTSFFTFTSIYCLFQLVVYFML